MKAIIQDRYGASDVLQLREIDQPAPGAGEVLVAVRAAGVDPGVWHLMTGRPYLVRAMGFGLRRPKVTVRGRDLAGVVERVGAGVTGFRPGDEVFGTCETGTFAEYAPVPVHRLGAKPARISFEQAAASPISGVTALQAVRDCGEVRAGQRVMVIGAAGGVGSFAVQLARTFGATVTAGETCGEVESTKSVSDLYAPVTGEVTETNPAVVDDPSLINSDPYGAGWLFKVAAESDGPLLSAQEYASKNGGEL